MIGLLRKIGLAAVDSTKKPQSARTLPDVAQSLVSQVIWDWPDSTPFRVDRVLESHPELANSDRSMIDLAVEEFADRRDAGEDVSATLFAQRFPRVHSELLDSLLFEHAIEDMTDWFRDVLEAPSTDEIQWPVLGDEIAGLRLVEPLGRGGFSRVFLAEDLEYENRRVAVKICRNDTHEASTLADLQHSGLGIVHYVRQVPQLGLVAICMPFASRTTLHDVLRRAWQSGCPNTSQQVWNEVSQRNQIERDVPLWAHGQFREWAHDLTIGMANAVAASHEQDIVHCDIKPSNVLVTPEGLPIVIDFNVAFRHSAKGSPANVGGTLPYMAPEQIRAFAGEGYAEIGPHTDVFGIGATVYQLLTGRLPFGEVQSADNGIQHLLEIRKTPVEPIRVSNPQVDPAFDELIRACLSYDPRERPQDAQALAEQLVALRHRTHPARMAPGTRIWLGITAVAAVLLATLLPLGEYSPAATKQELRAAGLAVPGLLPRPAEDAADRTASAVLVPDGPDSQTQQLVDEGLAAYQRGLLIRQDGVPGKRDDAVAAFRDALSHFKTAFLHDTGHKGAFVGWIRSLIQLDRASEAGLLGDQLKADGTPDTGVVKAVCLMAAGNYRAAASTLDAAFESGLESDKSQTLLGFCRFRGGDYVGAVEVMEKLRRQSPQPVPTVNLVLAQASLSVMMQGREKKIDADYIRLLLDECPEGIERGVLAPEICVFLGRVLRASEDDALRLWSKRALAEFRLGRQYGLELVYWNRFRKLMDEDVESGCEFHIVPAASGPDHGPLFLTVLDPFSDLPQDQLRSRNLQAREQSALETKADSQSMIAHTR
jgi:serine/threonine protein kinase/tetratricopeptide (TPR) repeat protein